MTRGTPPRRPRARTATEQHRAWLELVDRDGPFLAIPALKRVWPQGIGSISDDARDSLRDAKPDFDRAWDAWLNRPDSDEVLEQYRGARDKWVHSVLQDVAGWGKFLTWEAAALPGGTPRAASPSRAVTVEATGAFVRKDDVAALVFVIDPVASLRDPSDDLWSASAIDRMDAMLRSSGHRIGIVTDGRWWGVVSAQPETMTASGVVDAQTWIEESDVRDAFFALIDPLRLAGGKECDRLAALFAESVTAAEEITVALGTQVRRAVELLVSAFSESALAASEQGHDDPLPANRDLVYEGAVTAMMRVVFLLFAEERSMMPQSALFTEGYGVSGELDKLDARAREEGSEALDGTHHAWHRLLATTQALYSGVTSEDMRLPAYGGSLFDAERFPFLTARDERGALSVAVSDRVMLEVLRAVQYAAVRGENRRISFRDVDVEQIGYIYEGLLGYTARDVDMVTVGLIGKEGEEPEIPLDTLDDLYEAALDDADFAAALVKWVKENQSAATGRTAAAIKKALAPQNAPDDAERALLAVAPGDANLREHLRGYIGIIRRDLRNRPVVIRPGGLAVVETPSRANSGAHYTPKSLAREVVLNALEPLVYQPGPHQTADQSQWKLLSSTELLNLNVADIACGSGAFLVAAAEYLAERLVEAWHAEGVVSGSAHELSISARRYVVANCLYGADINGMAVEMCKLSLWLVSLDPALPFSFVDDRVLHGNSLLGITNTKQLEALHIDPSRAKTFQSERAAAQRYSTGTLFGEGSEALGIEMLDVRGVLRRAIDLRRRLADPVAESDPQRSTAAKRRLWRDYQALTATLSHVADGVIASGLALSGKPGRALDEAFETLRIGVDRAYAHGGAMDPTMLSGTVVAGLTPTVRTDHLQWKPLHWVLAVPDVMERGGFDAIIGNPPFLGGKKISGSSGKNFREFLVNTIAGGRAGEADLVAYFLLRAVELLAPNGCLGLIASESIGEGESRRVALDHLVGDSFTLYRADKRRKWPTEASVHVSVLWATKSAGFTGERCLDGAIVEGITSSLERITRVSGTPLRLLENQGLSFMGSILSGKGFILSGAERSALIARDPLSEPVIRPMFTAKEVNEYSDVTPVNWVIDFEAMSLGEAMSFPGAFARVERLVKPVREKVKKKQYRDRWWLFAERGRNLYKQLSRIDHALGIVLTSDTMMPARLPTTGIITNSIGVICLPSFAHLAVLSSSVHQVWAMRWGSSLDAATRYTTSDVFETFPLPVVTPNLETLGETLDLERREIMRRRGLGLTSLYKLVNSQSDRSDADVVRLRHVHAEISDEVLAAYGWDDIRADHGFHTYRNMERWTVNSAVRVEILDRLLEENHRRGAAQAIGPAGDSVDEDGDEE
ncbi:conserved hypothetical protein [Xylanimonas cellulosilytica DSM 15894]|uniref:site-specific DNA-methyltransferase (adenine-specific) n=1 Tax=Xylanimonas cellulosilytica (strain DSM 15894 / JCM 12276 / CECT 5975 / KCTC 9989 / LMG 20990 / NBRC 107835 / XIL07) TaxID=446471 RepID=D1BVM1_XYLCX|nr:DNA methyltransferase [Xylanimonas cellulosilytica]ACZ31340.1 conserved hypothetical protein [Xylanimonas cellulosilytica DSM 15894]